MRTESPFSSRFAGRHVHFIGIGGCGMSGLARMLHDSGALVTGSEPSPNQQTLELSRGGVRISRDQLGELLSRDIDLVVRTAAVPDSNAEYLAARAMSLRVIKYAELLGQVMEERFGIAVAGTHGKSTTTAMIAYALLHCGVDPSFVVGGTVPQLGGGSRSGAGRLFVAEACEYDRSFHHLRPKVAAITNIEEDHLDCYHDIDEIVESFRRFAQLVPGDGLILANCADARTREAMGGVSGLVEWVSCGTGCQPVPHGPAAHATWQGRPIQIEKGCWGGEVLRDGQQVASLRLSVPGEHNLFNATMAVAACAAAGVDPAAAAAAISRFTGVERRMSFVGRCGGALIVDDYGHHPTEIRVTLQAIREKYQPRRLICIFQPHQHSRTRFLLDDFAASFALADEVIVPDIYFVRDSESERQRVSAMDLVEKINANGRRALYLPSFAEIVEHLRGSSEDGDVIVTMGAGNVWEIGRELVI